MPLRHSPLLALLMLASCGFMLALAWPLFRGELWNADDLSAFHWPLRAFYGQCLQSGDAFDWMPSLFGGFYLTGEGQIGTYHPWHWLLYRTAPWPAAFAIECLVNYPLLLVGTYVWLRPLVRTREAALFGALCFAFGSFTLLRFVHVNAVAVIAHVPWLLASQRRFGATGWELRTTFALPLLTASQILLGYPQYVWFTALAEFTWGLALWGRAWRPWLGFASLKFVGLALGAVQLLPTYDWLGESQRMAASSQFYTTYSVTPIHWVLFLAPYFTKGSHEFPLFLGVVPTACLVVASIDRRLRASRVWRWCCIAALLSFVLALGAYGGLFYWQRFLPVVGSFRVPSRYLFLTQLALTPVIARGFDLWRRLSKRNTARARRVWIDAALAFVGVGIVSVVRADGAARWAALVPAVVSLAVLMAWRIPRRQAVRTTSSLVALHALDLLVFGAVAGAFLESAPTSGGPDLPTPPPQTTARLVLQPQTLMSLESFNYSNDLVRRGWRQVDGYAGLPPRSRLLGPGAGIAALRVANAQAVWNEVVPEEFAGLGPVRDGWREVPDPLPRVRSVGNWLVSHDPRTDVERIDPARTALVERPLETTLAPDADAALAVRVDRPGRLELDTQLDGARLVVFAERYHRGWRATVDGRPVENLRLYGDFQGCIVPTGQHVVEFHFDPDSLRQGKRVSLGALAGLMVLGVILAVRALRSRTVAAPTLGIPRITPGQETPTTH